MTNVRIKKGKNGTMSSFVNGKCVASYTASGIDCIINNTEKYIDWAKTNNSWWTPHVEQIVRLIKAETTNINLDDVTGGANPQRIEKIESIKKSLTIEELENLRLEECSDECKKIGSGGRNKGNAYAYQVWAVWN